MTTTNPTPFRHRPACWILFVAALALPALPAHGSTTIPAGTISTDTSWTLAGSPYIVTGNVTVTGTDGPDSVTTLTIEPGVEVRFQGSRTLKIGNGVSNPGALIADGDAAGGPLTITFTSNSGAPAAGDWSRISFYDGTDGSSVLRNALLEYGGGGSAAPIWMTHTAGTTVTLQDLTIRDSQRYGIYQNGGDSLIDDVRIYDTAANGIHMTTCSTNLFDVDVHDVGDHAIYFYQIVDFSLDGGSLGPSAAHDIYVGSTSNGTVQNLTSIESVHRASATSSVAWSGNTFNNWGARTSRVTAGELGGLIADNTFNKVPGAFIEVIGGTVALDSTWTDAVGQPYVMRGDTAVQGTDGVDGITTLTLEPGLELSFAGSYQMNVGGSQAAVPGALVADAGGLAPITLTSDSPTPSPGDWDNLNFRPGAKSSVLRNVVVEYAGAGNNRAVRMTPSSGSSMTLDDVTIRDSLYDAIYMTGVAVLDDVTILNCGRFGLSASTGQLTASGLSIDNCADNAIELYNMQFAIDDCSLTSNGSHDIKIGNLVTGTVQNCPTIDSIWKDSTNSSVTWTGNTFPNWGARTSRVGADSLGGLIANNAITAVPGAVVEVSTATAALDAAWTAAVGNPYIILGSVTVEGTDGGDGVTTLQLDPGLELRFRPFGNFYVGTNVGPGALIADGNATGGPATIRFTSDSSAPAAGDWRAFYFRGAGHDGSLLRNVLVEYGGAWIAGIYSQHTAGTTLTLEDVTIRHSGAAGFRKSPGNVVLTDVTVEDSGASGLYLDGAGHSELTRVEVSGSAGYGIEMRSSTFSVTDCDLSSNGDHDLWFPASVAGTVDDSSMESVYYYYTGNDIQWNGNTFNGWGARTSRVLMDDLDSFCSGNTFNSVPGAYLEVRGNGVDRDCTWNADPGPYEIITSVGLAVTGSDGPDGKTTLTLEPGTTIRMPDSKAITVNMPAQLIADGRLGGGGFSTVNLTSSSPAPATGIWGGVRVLSGGRVSFHDTQIRYADTGLLVDTATLGPVDRLTVNRANIGLDLDNATLEQPITRSTFRNCDTAVRSYETDAAIELSDLTGGSWGVLNQTPSTHCIDATGNWWNALDGPAGDPPALGCELDTAFGSGARVSEAVVFDAWLNAPSDDGDGIPCDDGDGFFDPCTAGNTIDCDDNCCVVANVSQEDVDSDGTGDACDDNPVLRVSSDPADGADFAVIQDAVDAAFQSGTRIEIFPGLGNYFERVRLDRLPAQVFSVCGLDAGGSVIVEGVGGPALNLVNKPLGVSPVRVEHLTLTGTEGLRSTVDTVMTDLVFTSIGQQALALDAGDHRLERSTIDNAQIGAEIADGARLEMRLGTIKAYDAGLVVAGVAELENTTISGAVDGIRMLTTGVVDLSYCTVAGQTGVGIDNVAAGTLLVDRSIVHGNSSGDILPNNAASVCPGVTWSDVGSPDCTGAGNNLSADPLLDTALRLSVGSPCLDHGPSPATYTGQPPTDLVGEPRLIDHDGDGLAENDCGAYEAANPGLVPGEVAHVRWDFDFRMLWDAEGSADRYHIYRGLISGLAYTDFGICQDGLDGDLTDTQLDDLGVPGSGAGWFYLVTAESTGEEGTLGLGTRVERSNFAPCVP